MPSGLTSVSTEPATWFGAALALGAGAGALPLAYLRFKRQRRLKAFNQQLPHVLDLIKSSLEAGHSLQRALQVVVAEFGDPIGGELRIVTEQSRIGLPLPRALENMTERIPDEDLALLTVAVTIQSEVGSSLAQIIGRLSELVRVRQRLQLQIHAMTSQSRLSGIVVGLLPVILPAETCARLAEVRMAVEAAQAAEEQRRRSRFN